MNRAAEKAAPAARSIFECAFDANVFQRRSQDPDRWRYGPDAHFTAKTFERITVAFKPTVKAAMDETGVTNQDKQLTVAIASFPFGRTRSFEITDYVVVKALDGLFLMAAEEERKIRTNPAAQITPLLKQDFR